VTSLGDTIPPFLSPTYGQELDMSIEDEVTAIAERIESDKKKHSKGHDGKAWEQPKAQTTEQSGEEVQIPFTFGLTASCNIPTRAKTWTRQ